MTNVQEILKWWQTEFVENFGKVQMQFWSCKYVYLIKNHNKFLISLFLLDHNEAVFDLCFTVAGVFVWMWREVSNTNGR